MPRWPFLQVRTMGVNCGEAPWQRIRQVFGINDKAHRSSYSKMRLSAGKKVRMSVTNVIITTKGKVPMKMSPSVVD